MLLADALIDGIDSEGVRWSIHILFEFLISFLAMFLILLVLVQRGRGGGIAGALGGMGGNSAFGTKAGDTFTWITYGTAAVWILLAMLTIKTFTDPPQDRARVNAQREESEELPESPLDLTSPTDGEDAKTDDTEAVDRDAKTPGVSAEKEGDNRSSTPVADKDDPIDDDKAVPETDDPKAKAPDDKPVPPVDEPEVTPEPKEPAPRADDDLSSDEPN